MGNCIGKKSGAKTKHRKHISSTISSFKLHCKSQLDEKQTDILICHLPDVKQSDILFNENDENIIQCSLSVSTTCDDQCLSINTPLPVQLPIQCENFRSNNTMIDISENNLTPRFSMIINEQDISLGQLFSKETEINDDQEVPNLSEEIFLDSLNSSPSPSLIESSFSSLSCNTTSFSSQDHLILSSSSSCTDIIPILSSDQLVNHKKFLSFPSTEQIYFDNQSTNEIFSSILPLPISRSHNDSFLNQFHQNIISHKCKTLSSVIDDVAQQQFIRIHQRTKPLLLEHKQFQCIQLKDIQKFDTPSLVFDNEQKFVYITKYARWNEFQSITCNIKDVLRIFSSCDDCLSLLSGSKLNNYLRPFLYANSTYNLVQMYSNKINNHNNNIFGYISQKNPNHIRQTIINNSKLSYSYDLDVDHTSLYFVLRIHSWPEEIRSIFEQRQRVWPINIDNLFNNTCFIRFNHTEYETPSTAQCRACEKLLSSLSNSTWSYTYAAIESQLISAMSDGQIRFASIVWNYLHGKTQGQLPFVIFKHTLFYFFEQYSFDSFQTSDLLNYIHIFTDFLRNCCQRKSIPHYFNSNYNLYNDDISMNLISMKISYLDLKTFSVYILPKSSLYLYHLMYLIEFQTHFFHSFPSTKTNLIQTIFETHELVIKQLSIGINKYQRQLNSIQTIKSHRLLTLDCLYRYQEDNVHIILDYLSLLREKEPSLLIHSLWSIFIQYFNSLFDDLFIS